MAFKDPEKFKHNYSNEHMRKISALGNARKAELRFDQCLYRHVIRDMLNMSVNDEGLRAKIRKLFPEIPETDITYKVATIAALITKSVKGNVRAFEVLRDSVGENPTLKLDTTMSISTIAVQDLKRIDNALKKIQEAERVTD